jgi:hypothetical protein
MHQQMNMQCRHAVRLAQLNAAAAAWQLLASNKADSWCQIQHKL